eukprot:2690077-Pleurochrysis_carterae.AAC.3
MQLDESDDSEAVCRVAADTVGCISTLKGDCRKQASKPSMGRWRLRVVDFRRSYSAQPIELLPFEWLAKAHLYLKSKVKAVKI